MKRIPGGTLTLILGLSVLLRVGVAFYLGDVVDAPPLLTDQRSYHALGERLITGHGFSFDKGWYPFTPPDTPTAHWSFLYSLFVAAVYSVFGAHPLAVRIVQAIIGGIVLPLMVYGLTRRLFEPSFPDPPAQKGLNGDSLALWAAGIASIYLYFVLYAATLMTETFYITALLWTLDRALVTVKQPTPRQAVALGLGLGVTTLLRQSVLPWVAVLAVWMLWVGWRHSSLRRMSGTVIITGCCLLLPILPFTVRNYAVYGEFLLLNSNAGYAMYSAQHPMQGTTFNEFAAAPVPSDLAGLNEAQLDRELMRRGIGFVLADPGRYLLLSLSRIPDYFEFWPTPDTTLINNIGRTGSVGLFLPFMLYGLWLAFRQAGPHALKGWGQFSTSPLAMLVLFVIFYSLLHILTWAMPRYRLPVDAVMVPFAALALHDLVQRISAKLRSRRRLNAMSE